MDSSSKKFFYLSFALSGCLYLLLYWLSFGQKPVLSLHESPLLLKQQPNIALGIESRSNRLRFSPVAQKYRNWERRPQGLFRQELTLPSLAYIHEKQSHGLIGQSFENILPLWPIRYLVQKQGALVATQFFHLVCGFVSLLLFGLLLWRNYTLPHACLGMFFLCLEPLFIAQYPIWLSEKYFLPILLLVILLGQQRNNIYLALAGLLAGFGLSLKISFLAALLCVLLVLRRETKTKEKILFITTMLLSYLPTVVLSRFELSKLKTIQHYIPIKELFHAIANKVAYLDFLTYQQFNLEFQTTSWFNLSSIELSWMSLTYFIFIFSPLLWPQFSQKIKFNLERYKPLYLCLIVFGLFTFLIEARDSQTPLYYRSFFILSPLLALINVFLFFDYKKFIYNQFPKVKTLLCLIILSFQVYPLVQWLSYYKKQPIHHHYDYKTYDKIVKDLLADEQYDPITVSSHLVGPLELLSSEILWPRHAYHFETDTIFILMDILDQGVMVLNLLEDYSDRYQNMTQINIIKFIQDAKKAGIGLSKQKFYSDKNGVPIYWKFYFTAGLNNKTPTLGP